jgi:membrane-associated phospholipid phosphatase
MMTQYQRFGFGTAAVVIATVAACISQLDYPIAAIFLHHSKNVGVISKIFSGHVLVAAELCLIAVLAALRVRSGTLPYIGKCLLVACSASVMAYALNDAVLKLFFGRQTPKDFYTKPLAGVFHFFEGSEASSFPSGHMMLTAAFLGAIVRFYPRLLPIAVVALFLGAAALVIGDWHFVSDTISGIAAGTTIGLAAGELWLAHLSRNAYDVTPPPT